MFKYIFLLLDCIKKVNIYILRKYCDKFNFNTFYRVNTYESILKHMF